MSSSFRLSLLALGIGVFITGCGPTRVGVVGGIGAGPPICPYGYYEAPPYDCAPDGYYGPEWFDGGVFIGAGPWFHGRDHFYGHVDHALDYRKGYRGPRPARNEAPRAQRAPFRGQAMHDPRGHEAPRSARR